VPYRPIAASSSGENGGQLIIIPASSLALPLLI
jgi:hypothetical protein